MKRRITISLEAELERIIRNKQAGLLLKANHSVSFSEMLNRILREALQVDQTESVHGVENDEKNQDTMVNAKGTRVYSKMLNSVQRKAHSRQKDMEIESQLNSVYNRLV
jgi:hypothetical protein